MAIDLLPVIPNWIFVLGNVVLGLFGVAIYVYHALAWQTIGKKQKYKRPWLAWIPFANVSMILQMGRFNWAWVFLVLIPILGWIALFILLILSMWRIFEKAKYPGWASLSMILPTVGKVLYLIVIGLVAWKKPKK
ncbi:hypothetical protein GW932_00420 [archaeon]|nr:hypothetical protein [archaeon]